MKFTSIEKHDFFILNGTFGDAEFMKLNAREAICINSSNGTYEKGTIYTIQWSQEITKTNI